MNTAKETYSTVAATFVRRTANAVMINTPADEETWIPRSLIHSADDRHIDDLDRGDEFTFRIMEWKAKELGL